METIGITELPELATQEPRKTRPTTTIGIGQHMDLDEKSERLDELLRQATTLGLADQKMIEKMKFNIQEVSRILLPNIRY